jgi:protein SCO1/2
MISACHNEEMRVLRRPRNPGLVRAMLLAAAALALTAPAARALPRPEIGVEPPAPKILSRAGFDQRLGEQVPVDLVFTNELGRAVTLREIAAGKPVLLVLAYYGCPMLCTYVLNGVGETVREIGFTPGDEYEIVTVSFDPTEGPDLAAGKKASYATEYGIKDGRGWHFLVGGQEAIEKLTASVGFKYAYDEQSEEYAHASGIMVMTGEGKLSHYFYGVKYPSRDVRLALVEASKGRIGTPVDQLLLFCYHYDPVAGKYSAAAMRILQLGALGTVLALASFLIVMFRRELRVRPATAGG